MKKKGTFITAMTSAASEKKKEKEKVQHSQKMTRIWLIISARMDPQSVNGSEGPCRSPLWTRTLYHFC